MDLDKAELRQGESAENVKLSLLDHAGGKAVEASRVKGAVTMSVVLKDSAGTEHELWTGKDIAALKNPVTIELPQDVAIGNGILKGREAASPPASLPGFFSIKSAIRSPGSPTATR